RFKMNIEDTKHVEEIKYNTELVNEFLGLGWTLLLTYSEKDIEYSRGPYFILGWQKEENPIFPESYNKKPEMKKFKYK
ncbi:MAG: hypothetical protein JW794_03875, partial [Candidatus Cloacimonetes bacterium]|nr:hypothetical protein [Candidatus Cloacimonadota bacterium]